MIASMVATIILISIDKFSEIDLVRIKRAWSTISSDKEACIPGTFDKPDFRYKDIFELDKEYWLNVASAGL